MNWNFFVKPLPSELLTDYPYINEQLEHMNQKLIGPLNHKAPLLLEMQQHLLDIREQLANENYDHHQIIKAMHDQKLDHINIITFQNMQFIKKLLYHFLSFTFIFFITHLAIAYFEKEKLDISGSFITSFFSGIIFIILFTLMHGAQTLSLDTLYSKSYTVKPPEGSTAINIIAFIMFIVLPSYLILTGKLDFEPLLMLSMLFFAFAFYSQSVKIHVYSDVIIINRFGFKTTIPWVNIKDIKPPLLAYFRKYSNIFPSASTRSGKICYINKKGKARVFNVPHYHINANRLLGDVIRHCTQHKSK